MFLVKDVPSSYSPLLKKSHRLHSTVGLEDATHYVSQILANLTLYFKISECIWW